MTTKEEVLQNCTVEGNIVKLPPIQLERKLYLEVAKALEFIGGKWKGGKVAGFVFQEDPAELLARISEGENVNLKKEFQFFPTPDNIAYKLVELADLDPDSWGYDQLILEPSAGQGAIMNAIRRICRPEQKIHYCELNSVNLQILRKREDGIYCGPDFLDLQVPDDMKFHRIIANPPFANNQDIAHIRHMYELLRPGGKIVTLASRHWQISSNRKEREFCEWLENEPSESSCWTLEAGTFKSSGTMIEMNLLQIKKPYKAPLQSRLQPAPVIAPVQLTLF